MSGWNDPRIPTISGLKRRGYTPASIRDFSERIGVSKVNSLTDISILETSIRDDLNISAPRAMAVINPVKLVIENYPEGKIESLSAPVHPQNEKMGTREIFFNRGISMWAIFSWFFKSTTIFSSFFRAQKTNIS